MDLFTLFLIAFGIVVAIKLYSNRKPKSRGFIQLAPLVITPGIILALAFAVPWLLGGVWKIFVPPPQPLVPIWVWIIGGFLILIVAKVMTERRSYQ